jgi:nucleoside-diphosphate-sugar epimerase
MAQILVLGGTGWLGGTVAATGVALGHHVTCLARGTSGLTPDGTHLVQGDRDDPRVYRDLPDREWDLVVDVTRTPGHARGAVAALADRAANWVYVSSASVYARHDDPGADEAAALLPAFRGDVAPLEQYGEGKVACEQAVVAGRGPDALIARSGLIVGAGDPTDRFGYWPGRFALAQRDGGPVLVPQSAERPVQWVHVGDQAAWIVEAGLAGTTGILNVMGRSVPLREVLLAAAEVAGFTGRIVPVPDATLGAEGVTEFMGPRSLPLWLSDPDWRGFMARDTTRAEAAGLGHRPLTESLADALEWESVLGLERTRTGAGLDRRDELEILGRLAGQPTHQ